MVAAEVKAAVGVIVAAAIVEVFIIVAMVRIIQVMILMLKT